MLVKITCPGCKNDTGFSPVGGRYQGPFRCGHCKTMYNIKIENSEVTSITAFNKDDLWKIKKLQY